MEYAKNLIEDCSILGLKNFNVLTGISKDEDTNIFNAFPDEILIEYFTGYMLGDVSTARKAKEASVAASSRVEILEEAVAQVEATTGMEMETIAALGDQLIAMETTVAALGELEITPLVEFLI